MPAVDAGGGAVASTTQSADVGPPGRAVERGGRPDYLDHLTVERGLAANTLAVLPPGPAAVRRVPGRGRGARPRRGGRGTTSPASSPRCGRATPTTRRCRRPRRRGRWSPSAGCTGSRCSGRAGRPTTSAARGAAAGAAAPAAQGDPGRRRGAAARGGRRSTGTALALRDRALLELLYGTGARISEAVGLAVDDLDSSGGAVRAARQGRQGAGRPGRLATRCEAVEDYLVRARPALAAGGRGTRRRLFLNARGGALSRQSAWTILRAAAERAGLRGRGLPAHAAALVRDPPARRRRRRPGGAGAARARVGDARRRSTRWSPSTGCARCTRPRTRARRADSPADMAVLVHSSVARFSTCRPQRHAELSPASVRQLVPRPEQPYSRLAVGVMAGRLERPTGLTGHRRHDGGGQDSTLARHRATARRCPARPRAGPSGRDDGAEPRAAVTPTRPPSADPADPRARAADRARPGPHHRDVQPEGRRRQDHVDHQPGRGAGRVRPPGAAGRLRPAGRAVGRPGRPAAGPRPDHLQRADGARSRRSTTCC